MNLTEPLPLPDAPDVIEIHGEFVIAFHSHPLSVFIEKFPFPSPGPIFWVNFDSVYEHAPEEGLAALSRDAGADLTFSCADVRSVFADAGVDTWPDGDGGVLPCRLRPRNKNLKTMLRPKPYNDKKRTFYSDKKGTFYSGKNKTIKNGVDNHAVPSIVHGQLLSLAVIWILVPPPLAGRLIEEGLTVYVHGGCCG